MLGKQFENTYFGNSAYLAPTEIDEVTGREDRWKARENLNVINKNLSNWQADRPLQGLLFDPHTATNSGRDPLIDRSARISAIDTAFRLGPEHRDQYKKRFYGATKAPIGNIDENFEVLRDTAFNTNVPTDEFSRGLRGGRTVLVIPQEGREWAVLGGSGSTIKMNMHPVQYKEVVPAHKKWVSEASDEPLPNKNFWKWFDNNKHIGAAEEVLPDQLIDYHWSNPSTGEVFSESHPLHKEVYKHIYEKGHTNWFDADLDVLRKAGFVPNMFPGKASQGKGYSSGDTHELYMGGGYRGDLTRSAHARFKPAEAKQVDVPESYRYVNKKEINPRTLVHEIGHSQDSAWGGARGVTEGSDPRHEGIADAYEMKYSDVVASKATDPSMFGSTAMTGYGFSYFNNKPQQALYAALRAAILTTPDINTSEIPDYYQIPGLDEHKSAFPVTPSKPVTRFSVGRRAWRQVPLWEAKEIAEEKTRSRQDAATNTSMLLGHMVEHYPHIMPYLQQVGLDKHAVGAHNQYTAIRQRLETSGESVSSMYRSQQPPAPEMPAEYDPSTTSMSESQWEHQHDYDKDFGFRQRRTSQIPGQMGLF